ncbi:MAG: hypothetical protein JKY81_00200 [Colwellia sp.]|nr:hypothetical protein [Colwellia sp.]
MIDISTLQFSVTQGMDNFKVKHGKKINKDESPLTNYQVQKMASLSAKALDTIIASGGVTIKTLYKLGVGVGKYKGKDFNIVSRVLRDMDGG